MKSAENGYFKKKIIINLIVFAVNILNSLMFPEHFLAKALSI